MRVKVISHKTFHLIPETDSDEALLEMWDKMKPLSGGAATESNMGASHLIHLSFNLVDDALYRTNVESYIKSQGESRGTHVESEFGNFQFILTRQK